MGDGDGARVEVRCTHCGFLGAFYVLPGQPAEDARRRAEHFRDTHRCEFGRAEIAAEEG